MKNIPARLHPLVAIASIALIIFSVVGVAAMFGKIPGAESRPGEPFAQSPATASGAIRPADYPAPVENQRAQAPVPCTDCGMIESIRLSEVKGQASGVGAVAGGVAGGLIGNQIGHGTGRTVATIAGAAGGAYAGHTIEKNVKKHTVYRVTLRMDDGSLRTVSQREAPAYAVGDRVRLANGRITERV